MEPAMKHATDQTMNEPLYARVGRQVPLHGALVPLHDEDKATRETPQLRRMTIAMAALALAGMVALGAQLVHAAARTAQPPAPNHAQNVGAELATALHPRAASSPAADAAGHAGADARRP